MINLYIFNESSLAAVYGIGTYIRELTLALKGSKINICVIHLRSKKPDKEPEETDNIQHWYIPSSINLNTSLDLNRQSELYYRNVVYLLQLQIKDHNKLIFHLNYMQSCKLAEELKRAFKCKVITTVHYSRWGFSLSGNLAHLNRILSKDQPDDFEKGIIESINSEKMLYLQVDRIITLTKYMEDILLEQYNLNVSKINVIPNGLADSLNDNIDGTALRKKWMIDPKIKIILFAGRLDEVKGVKYLIQAFRMILGTISDCQLLIAGNGTYDDYMKESRDICTKITFIGLLEKMELYELYQIANIGVVPSLYEPFCYVAAEMMMHGLPMVVTATSGLNEVVDEICGFKVPVTEHLDRMEINTDLLAERILYLLQHPEQAKQMGKNARKRYLENYSLPIFSKNMLDFYKSLFPKHNNTKM